MIGQFLLQLPVQEFDVFIVHAGTCNITRQDVGQIEAEFDATVLHFRDTFPGVWLGFSAILPRPHDWEHTMWKVVYVNKLMQHKYVELGLMFFHTYKPFQWKVQPTVELFRDGLHLSNKGIRKLCQFVRSNMGSKALKFQSQALQSVQDMF